MKTLLKIISEIKIVGKLDIPADIITQENDDFDAGLYDIFDTKKIKDIINQYSSHLKTDLTYYSKPVNIKGKIFQNLIDDYVDSLELDGETESYKNITIKGLLKDFELYIENI